MLGAGCTIRFHTIVYKTASKLLQLKHYLKMVENCVAILYAIYRKKDNHYSRQMAKKVTDARLVDKTFLNNGDPLIRIIAP